MPFVTLSHQGSQISQEAAWAAIANMRRTLARCGGSRANGIQTLWPPTLMSTAAVLPLFCSGKEKRPCEAHTNQDERAGGCGNAGLHHTPFPTGIFFGRLLPVYRLVSEVKLKNKITTDEQ
jgi:hypothetical protein